MAETASFAGPLAAHWPTARRSVLDAALAAPDKALPVATAEDRGVWDLAHGRLDRLSAADVIRRARSDLGSPWPQATATAYARYVRDGDRDEYEQVVFSRQRRLSRAAVAAAVTLDPLWLDEVTDGVIQLCEQSTWCWPAHDDSWRRRGSVLATVTEPYLDLGAGEVVGQLGWLDHLLGARLDERVPGLRARIRHEARVRVIDPFVRRRDWHWLGLDGDVHNWNPWIHGNVLIAALRLVEDRAERAHVVDLVIEGLDRYVASLPADGAIDEGYAYWWNGACRAHEALDVLRHATGGVFDASQVPALRATVAFPHRMHLGGDWYLNLADGSARPPADQPWDALHRAALQVGDEDARRHAASHRWSEGAMASEREGLGRLLRALTDQNWLHAEPASPPLPRDVWLASTQVLLARQEAGTASGLTLAIKGGHNAEHHNHNDVGSVVVAVDGVPVVVDAGRPTYTAQTFGPDRYRIWTMQSSWHCVPEIRGTAQHEGKEFAARDVQVRSDEAISEMSLDLAGAYPGDDVRHWWRTARLDRSTGSVTILDSWQLVDPTGAQTPEPPTVHYLLAGDVHLADGRALVRASGTGTTVVLEWEPLASAVAEIRPLDDPVLSGVWGDHLTRLTIAVGAGSSGTLTVTVEVQG